MAATDPRLIKLHVKFRCSLKQLTPEQLTPRSSARAELMLLGQIHGIVQGLRYMGYVGTQDNLVRR